METVIVNLVEPGDRVVARQRRVRRPARRGRAPGPAPRSPPSTRRGAGSSIARSGLAETIARVRPHVVALVHAETSTGVAQPVDGIAELVHADPDGLLILDCVTSVGGMPVALDAWGVDAAYSGTQKCLASRPGWRRSRSAPRRERRSDAAELVPRPQADRRLRGRASARRPPYHHTAPTSMVVLAARGARPILAEGLAAATPGTPRPAGCWSRGSPSSASSCSPPRAPPAELNAVRVPAGVDAATVRRSCSSATPRDRRGRRRLRGNRWRIGLMGPNARPTG